ncbi:MAG: hypothetical protein IJ068_07005 [Bacilli bacterium]|nr:hypothetical protein [Bacilli bacterium]
MKKLFFLIVILILFTGCRSTDSIMFKTEYESLNSNSSYTKVSIASDNPFVYVSDTKLAELVENKEDLVVLFGYSKSNDTRNIIENIIKISKDLGIDTIYYLDILDIRNELATENGSVITTKEGSDSYDKILELLGDVAEDYIVDGNIVGKRIYAPSILVIKDKEIKGIVNGKSYLESDEEREKDSYNQILEHLKKYSSNTCSVDSAC